MRRMLQRVALATIVIQSSSCTATYVNRSGTAGATGGSGGGGVLPATPSAGQPFAGLAPQTNYNAIFGAGR